MENLSARPLSYKPPPSSPIGVFDSGVGGLTVLKEIIRQLPGEDVVYFADTARVPYGNRSPEEILSFNREIIRFLVKRGVKMVIMACGTSSSLAYPVIKDEFAIYLVSLIEPGAEEALAATHSGKIGVIATSGTVNSGAYEKAIKTLNPDLLVYSQACPLFVPLVEGGCEDTEEARKAAREYLTPLLNDKIDTLVLGCTHYPHLSKVIREVAGPEVALVDPAGAAVAAAKRSLKKAGTLKPVGAAASYEYLTTGEPRHFQELGSRLLGKNITRATRVDLPLK
ncbi:MAG: glutamate racemase [Candidatus Margulisbacteria bacterium]|nr:glutamate racemase [Candidatus Margulisiibacteriota bacterium]